ncbi:hypothetical protein [Rhodovulum sp. PH10]|uniref:hypothetical protein n=1 Tax=Rhodovulum sp. PH10 TaxID=1187851 RepID=UPI00058E0934|nr:hypothetical protein [Rhodovulum sp. PH10]
MRAAIVGCLTGESVFTREIRTGRFYSLRRLEDWLAFFGLADDFPAGQKLRLLRFLEEEAGPRLAPVTGGTFDTFTLVDDLEMRAVRSGLVTNALPDVVTSFACSAVPSVYAPMTGCSQRGLRTLGAKLGDLGYCTYMTAFMKELERFAARTAAVDLPAPLPMMWRDGPLPGRDVVAMRALDRRLKAAGGFPLDRLETEAGAFVGWSHLTRNRIVPLRPTGS